MDNSQTAETQELTITRALNNAEILEKLKQKMIEADGSYAGVFEFKGRELDPVNIEHAVGSADCKRELKENKQLKEAYDREKQAANQQVKANVFEMLAASFHRKEVLEPRFKTEFLSRAHAQNEKIRKIQHDMQVNRLLSAYAQNELLSVMREKGLSGNSKKFQEALKNAEDTRLVDSINQMRAAQQNMTKLEQQADVEKKLCPEAGDTVFKSVVNTRKDWEEELAQIFDTDIEIPDGSAFLDALKSIFNREADVGVQNAIRG
ncbi:hypothetical protein [Shewanella colwelliana]|uniref:hypothetical protein n=1 Tax=Shewanella colwelliana TaxID=23 RepID=UPI0022B079D3|nr:hypothetical protein [Shewanella colwelliana]MCZ4337788.1 hypothetical protein [Shewanella colwelliana]